MNSSEITQLQSLHRQACEVDLACADIALRIRTTKEHKQHGFTSEADYLAQRLDINPSTARRIFKDATMLALANAATDALIRGFALSLDLVRLAYRSITSLPRKQRKDAFNQLIPKLQGKTFAEGKQWLQEQEKKKPKKQKPHTQRSGVVSRVGELTHVRGKFEGAKAAQVESAIRDQMRRDYKGPNDPRTHEQRMADAIHQLITGQAGSGPSSLSIIVPCDPAKLETFLTTRGNELTAAEANELVQQADRTWVHFVDAVTLQPLALGQTKRLASFAQRMELLLRQRTCIIPGCKHRADKCQVHHVREFKDGGGTDIDNLVFVCHSHHQLLTHNYIKLWAEGTNWVIEVDGTLHYVDRVAQDDSAVDRLRSQRPPPT